MNMNHIIALADPFVDKATGEVYLNVPVRGDEEPATTHEVALDSDEAQAWVEKLLTDMYERQTRGNETKKGLDVLWGAALERPRRKAVTAPPPKPEVKRTALSQVVEHFADRGDLSGENGHLLAKLTNAARTLGLLDEGSNFPTTVDQLGTQLGHLVEPMAAKGIRIESHNTRPRKWTIHQRDRRVLEERAVGHTDSAAGVGGDAGGLKVSDVAGGRTTATVPTATSSPVSEE